MTLGIFNLCFWWQLFFLTTTTCKKGSIVLLPISMWGSNTTVIQPTAVCCVVMTKAVVVVSWSWEKRAIFDENANRIAELLLVKVEGDLSQMAHYSVCGALLFDQSPTENRDPFWMQPRRIPSAYLGKGEGRRTVGLFNLNLFKPRLLAAVSLCWRKPGEGWEWVICCLS